MLFTGLMLEQIIMLSHRQTFLASDLPLAVPPAAAFLAIIIILNMPLRDPMLPRYDISAVHDTPTIKLRTPEDNLTPWQYMTVSWMEPLIKKGKTRQMEDSDIWDLGWEFKHARLHDAFGALEGSVTKKVFVANGMDLLRTTLLNVVRLCASKSCTLILSLCLQSNNGSSAHARLPSTPPCLHGTSSQSRDDYVCLCDFSIALDLCAT
jgi:hypothetical protein